MTSPYEQMAEDAVSDYRRRRDDVAGLQQKLGSVSSTVKSPRQVVSVTVGGQGEITEIKFPTGAYKNMTPTELSSVILKTIQDARAKAIEQVAELLGSVLPPGFSAKEVLSGKADLRAMLPAEPRSAEAFFDNANSER
jgi:DNA-binding protein YbaB